MLLPKCSSGAVLFLSCHVQFSHQWIRNSITHGPQNTNTLHEYVQDPGDRVLVATNKVVKEVGIHISPSEGQFVMGNNTSRTSQTPLRANVGLGGSATVNFIFVKVGKGEGLVVPTVEAGE